jgi:hypothetical protein
MIKDRWPWVQRHVCATCFAHGARMWAKEEAQTWSCKHDKTTWVWMRIKDNNHSIWKMKHLLCFHNVWLYPHVSSWMKVSCMCFKSLLPLGDSDSSLVVVWQGVDIFSNMGQITSLCNYAFGEKNANFLCKAWHATHNWSTWRKNISPTFSPYSGSQKLWATLKTALINWEIKIMKWNLDML